MPLLSCIPLFRTALSRLCLIGVLGAALAVSACEDGDAKRLERARRVALPVQMVPETVAADPFLLTVFQRIHNPGEPINVYIEGDGLAWLSSTRPSLDPTPRNPVALDLAGRDRSQNVLYLARPCQYTKLTTREACSWDYWTFKRFAPEVISAMNTALDVYKNRYDTPGFNLIGFSGGAAVAVLVAARRNDILSIRTVGGNLDHKTVSAIHNVSFLTGSLNPVDVASRVARIPQHHFLGEDDAVIKPAVFDSYLRASGNSQCIRYSVVPNATHETGWEERWPELLKAPLDCQNLAFRP